MKGIPACLCAVFLTFLAVFGAIFVGILFHEYLHLDSKDFSEEAVCIDYTGNSRAFAIMNKTNYNEYLNMTEEETGIARHFQIYYAEGVLVGILVVIVFVSLIVILYFIAKKIVTSQ